MKYEVLDIKDTFLSQNGHRIDFEIEKIIINIEHIRKENPIIHEEAFWFEVEIELEGHITDIGLLDIWESVNPDPLKLTIYEGDTEISFGNLLIWNIRMPTFSNYISIRLHKREKL